MNTSIEAVIFDLDGVIIDSEPIYLEINYRIFDELGIVIPENEYRGFVGVTDLDMWSTLKYKYKLPQNVEDLIALQSKYVWDYITPMSIEPISGIPRFLQYLQQKGTKCAIASSSSVRWITVILEKCTIAGFFNSIASAEMVSKGKPEPDVFVLAATMLNVLPKRCIVIEDSEKGIMAAKAAGMRCIAYKNPNSGDQDISSADMIIENIASAIGTVV